MTLLRTVRWPLVKTWLFIVGFISASFFLSFCGDKIISVIDDLTMSDRTKTSSDLILMIPVNQLKKSSHELEFSLRTRAIYDFYMGGALSKDNRRIPHTDFDIEADTKLFSSKGIIVWQTKKSIRNTPRGSIFSFNYKDIGQFQEFGKIKITNIKLVQLNKTEDWNNAYLLFYINRRHSFLD